MRPQTGDIPRIAQLPPLVASQIAAGEVVERPSSVVKELVENALDAGAMRIEVELEQGGIELVRVTDDGVGIHAEDLALALAAHATSKVRTASDLEQVATLGFRGEALASIASVSRLSIRTRTREEASALEISAEGDAVSGARPARGAPGTCVTVRTLFFNTPARRKFLRTVATEQTRCLDVVRDLAMSHPSVAFVASCDGRAVIDLAMNQSPRERVVDLLGRELEPELLEVHADAYDDARGLTLWGVVGKPSLARATNRSQHIFVNGRAVRDRTIQHALGEAFRGLIEPSRYPTAVLMIEMDPGGVDVNVHPTKAEVRFRDGSNVHSAVLNAVRRALREADLTPTFQAPLRPGAFGADPREVLPAPVVAGPQAFVDFFRRPIESRPQEPLNFEKLREAAASTGAGAPPEQPGATLVPPVRPVARHLQVHKSYVVTQDEEGMLIVDQHALHERAMFEYLLGRLRRGELESQRLLTPVVVPATEAQVDRLGQLGELFRRIGISAEALGPRTVGVHAFPTFLFERGVDPVEFMTELLERAEGSPRPASHDEEALRDVVNMMACKAAVKAGDALSEEELAELLRLREAVERSSNCPHGRPTSVRLTLRELERLFGRS